MMACGDKNAKILLRAGDGRDADNPCGIGVFCGSADVAAWGAQAQHVFDLVRASWNQLKAEEHKISDYTRSNALYNSVETYEKDFARLPDPTAWGGLSYAFGGFGSADEAVQAFMNNIADGACQLDLLNSAIVAMGMIPHGPGPGLPGRKHGLDVAAPTAFLVLGAVVVGLFLATRK